MYLNWEGRLFESANVTESFSDATAEPDLSFEIVDDQSVVSADSCLDDVQREGISLVASLRANSSIPYNAIPPIVNSCNHIATSLLVHYTVLRLLYVRLLARQ